jgi:hypothetical protein
VRNRYYEYSRQSPPLSTRSRHSLISHPWCYGRWISDCFHRRDRIRYSQYDYRTDTQYTHTPTQYTHTLTRLSRYQCAHGTPRSKNRPWIRSQWILGGTHIRSRTRPREYGPLTLDTAATLSSVVIISPRPISL